MSFIRFPHLLPSTADTTPKTLQKILQRLNDNASVAPDEPSANVVVTNTPLATTVGNFPATQPVSVAATLDVDIGADIEDGRLMTYSLPMEFEVGHDGSLIESGVDKDARLFRVLGKRAGFNSTSVLQDVGEWLSTTTSLLPDLTGGENLELVSSSGNDTAVGSGTQQVQIVYLDINYEIQTVSYLLNGITAVPVAEAMRFVYWMESVRGGTSEVSAGNITLRVTGTGVIHEQITAGGNRSLTARFMVPDGYKAYLKDWSVSAVGATMDTRLRATVNTFDRTIGTRYIFQDTVLVGAGNHAHEELPWMVLPARTKLKVSVLPSLAPSGNRIDAGFTVLILEL
jgi:hypothetical protein